MSCLFCGQCPSDGTRSDIDKTTRFDSLRANQQSELTHTVRELVCCRIGYRVVGNA